MNIKDVHFGKSEMFINAHEKTAFVFTFRHSQIFEKFFACGPKYGIVYILHMQGGVAYRDLHIST